MRQLIGGLPLHYPEQEILLRKMCRWVFRIISHPVALKSSLAVLTIAVLWYAMNGFIFHICLRQPDQITSQTVKQPEPNSKPPASTVISPAAQNSDGKNSGEKSSEKTNPEKQKPSKPAKIEFIETNEEAFDKGLFPLKAKEGHHDSHTMHITSTWILLLFAVIPLGYWCSKKCKRTVIDRFIDHTRDSGSGGQPVQMEGISQLLVNELVRLSSIGHTQDELQQRAIPTQIVDEALDPPFEMSYGIDIPHHELISSEAEVKIGTLTLPLGSLYSLANRITSGMHISGGLYKQEGKYVLAARCIWERRDMSWQTDPRSVEVSLQDSSLCIPRDMIEELACRIFTEFTFGRSAKWKAVRAYIGGIEIYRECLRTPDDRQLKLKYAEKKLCEALAEDEQFTIPYYNLGVVYTEMKQPDAARLAFEKAIKARSDKHEAYYALAVNYFGRKDYDKTTDICERVLNLQCDCKEAYYLKGRAELAIYDPEWMGNVRSKPDDLARQAKEAIDCMKAAVATSWLNLFSAYSSFGSLQALRGKPDNIIAARKKSVSNCLRNLAILYRFQATEIGKTAVGKQKRIKQLGNWKKLQLLRHAEMLCMQALAVDKEDANVYYELGRIYLSLHDLTKAHNKFELAIRIADSDPMYWASLTHAYALRYVELMREKRRHTVKGEDVPKTLEYECNDKKNLVHKSRKSTFEHLTCRLHNGDSSGSSSVAECVERLSNLLKLTVVEANNLDGYDTELGYVLSQKDMEKITQLCTHVLNIRNAIEKRKQLSSSRVIKICNKLSQRERDISILPRDATDWVTPALLRWACAELALTIGLHYLLSDNQAKLAETYLSKALFWFEDSLGKEDVESISPEENGKRRFFRREIQHHHLRAYIALARALQEGSNEKLCAALTTANRALDEIPLDGIEHEVIGQVYYSLDQYGRALDSFTNAHRWNPNSPEVHMHMGMTHFKMAQDSNNISDRNRSLDSAIHYLTETLDICACDNTPKFAQANYWLGKAYLEQSKPNEAVEHFKIARNLHTEKANRILPSWYLGVAYFRNGNLDECREEFQRVIDDATELVDTSIPITDERNLLYNNAGKSFGDDYCLGEVLVQALVHMAYSISSRNGISAEAYVQLENAEKYIYPLMIRYYLPQANGKPQTDRKKRLAIGKLIANIFDCAGWLLYKQDIPDAAISCCREAISYNIDPEAYYHVAMAYVKRYEIAVGEAKQKNDLDAALDYCRLARGHDIRGRYAASLKQLEQRIQQHQKNTENVKPPDTG